MRPRGRIRQDLYRDSFLYMSKKVREWAMFFETHHRMGQMLHDRLDLVVPGIVNRDAFVYGNVKPDLMRKGSKDRHMLTDTAPFLNLTAKFLQQPSMDPEEDWVLLGMVCHHVCDAFCRYHQQVELYRDYGRHLEYELGLNGFFNGWTQNGLALNPEGVLVDDSHPDGFFMPTVAECSQESGVLRLVAPRLRQYQAGDPSFFLDIRYALETSCLVVDAILGGRLQGRA